MRERNKERKRVRDEDTKEIIPFEFQRDFYIDT
jgi:hypothetical protein